MLYAVSILLEIPKMFIGLLLFPELVLKHCPICFACDDFVIVHYVAKRKSIETAPFYGRLTRMSTVVLSDFFCNSFSSSLWDNFVPVIGIFLRKGLINQYSQGFFYLIDQVIWIVLQFRLKL